MAWNSGTGGLEFSRPDPLKAGADSARALRGKEEAKEREAAFVKDMQNLTRLLTQNIGIYGSSESAGDKQMAKLYAEYLAMLQEPEGRQRAVREYRRGLIPGIGTPAAKKSKSNRPALMPPAWS